MTSNSVLSKMEFQLSFSLISLSLITLLILKLASFRRVPVAKSRTTKFLPGPWKLPIIGSIHHLAASLLPHHALRDLSRKYGPIMHLQLGEISTIVISSPQMAKEVLRTHDLAFADRPGLIDNASKLISFAPYGAYWKQMRKIVTSELLSPLSVRTFSSIRETEVMELIKHLRLSSGSPINLTESCCSLTSGITSRAAFGKRSGDEDIVIKLIKEASSLAGGFPMSYMFPSLKILHRFDRVENKMFEVKQNINTLMQKIVQEHQQATAITGRGNAESGEEDLVDVLLRHQRTEHLDCPFTTDHIKFIITDVAGGGVDTSSTTIEWAMAEMMKNPEVMEKAQKEVRQAFTRSKMRHETDFEGLEYLKWVIKETLRLHPPLPLLLPRESREQCEIDGYTIPVKTNVIVNAWAIGRDPEYWDDAESFIPERFKDISVGFLRTELQYIPFGAGRRRCPGMSFGIANIQFPLAQLLYNFDWKLPDGMVPEEIDMTEKFGVTAGRKKELYLVAIPYYPTP